MLSKELNGASSPTNCARKIAGPFILFIISPLYLNLSTIFFYIKKILAGTTHLG